MNQNGEWARSAMVEIFRANEEFDRFLNDVVVVGFINEQTMLDNFLFNGIKQQRTDLQNCPTFKPKAAAPANSNAWPSCISMKRPW